VDLVQQKKVQNFYLSTVDKIASIQKEMNKSGSNEQVRKLVATAINEGKQAMEQRKYRDASHKFRDALALEKGNKEATDLLEQAQVELRKRKRELLSEASNAYEGDRLSEAIQKYREVLALDDNDDDAQTFFANHSAEIKEHLRKIHRRGIDFYVAGRIKDAIAMWKGGRLLDPGEHEVNFSRDIEKAEKVLEVRGAK
jgi:tetratricopeptide (TPR) repeat protein